VIIPVRTMITRMPARIPGMRAVGVYFMDLSLYMSD
jgi:hypothetical protein